MKLHEKIISLRKRNGLSQEGLAEKIGVSRQAVSKWETGEALPEVTKLKALAETFGVTVDFLLDETKTEYTPPDFKHRRTLSDRYLDSIDNLVDKLTINFPSFIKRYGWIGGILLIICGIYRVLTCVFSLFSVTKISSVINSYMPTYGATGFAIVVTGFQILVGIACIVAGAVIIKKFKPKKESKK